jgi:hypothetical protein
MNICLFRRVRPACIKKAREPSSWAVSCRAQRRQQARIVQLTIVILKSGAHSLEVRAAQHRQFLSIMPGLRCSVKQSDRKAQGIREEEALVA